MAQRGPAPADYPVILDAPLPEAQNRLLALLGIIFFLKALLLLPHLIVLYVLNIIAAIVIWIGYWIILFTGRQPAGIHDFVLGVLRWQTRATAWLYSITDRYPPFSLR